MTAAAEICRLTAHFRKIDDEAEAKASRLADEPDAAGMLGSLTRRIRRPHTG